MVLCKQYCLINSIHGYVVLSVFTQICIRWKSILSWFVWQAHHAVLTSLLQSLRSQRSIHIVHPFIRVNQVKYASLPSLVHVLSSQCWVFVQTILYSVLWILHSIIVLIEEILTSMLLQMTGNASQMWCNGNLFQEQFNPPNCTDTHLQNSSPCQRLIAWTSKTQVPWTLSMVQRMEYVIQSQLKTTLNIFVKF